MENIKKYLNENQDPKTVEKVLNKIKDLLTSNETIEYIAVQKKPAINLSPDCIALTNRRVIFCRPKTLGFTMQFEDYQWKDIRDCHMKEGIMGATFTVKLVNNRINRLDYLPKAQARQLYRFAQEKEEEMAEYRRQRKLEESRAAAGGVFVQSPTMNEKPKADVVDPMESLKKLKELLANELISQEEYDNKKEAILKTL